MANNSIISIKKIINIKMLIVVCFSLFLGCAYNKTEVMNALDKRSYDFILNLKGSHDEIAKCFLEYEKKHAKAAIKLNRELRSAVTGVSPTSNKVRVNWDVQSLSREGYKITRVLCKELDTIIFIEYRYVVDFIQIKPNEVQLESYGRTYTPFSSWKMMECGENITN